MGTWGATSRWRFGASWADSNLRNSAHAEKPNRDQHSSALQNENCRVEEENPRWSERHPRRFGRIYRYSALYAYLVQSKYSTVLYVRRYRLEASQRWNGYANRFRAEKGMDWPAMGRSLTCLMPQVTCFRYVDYEKRVSVS
jgi:hypothetical protein